MKKYTEIGDRIRKLRGGLSQKEFAEKLGMSSLTLQRYEYGERVPPGPTLTKIAELCNVTTDFILTGEGFFFLLDKISETFLVKADVDQVKEDSASYGRNDVTEKILDLLKDMDMEAQRDVLKYTEKEKLLEELKRERQQKEGH